MDDKYISETLRQGAKFKKYQDKILKDATKKTNSQTVEGFTSSAYSKTLVSHVSNVQSAVQELNELQTRFESTLERYHTAHSQLMTTTSSFIGTKTSSNFLNGQNIYVNTVNSSAASDLIGSYTEQTTSPAMSQLTGRYTYDACQSAAINSGNQYFGMSDLDENTQTADCSVSNSLTSVTKYGTAVPKCSSGSDGKTYGGSMINALYSVNGYSSTYLGCYNDNADSRSMSASGPVLSNMSSAYAIANYNGGPWGTWAFVDKSAKWIWYTADATSDAPYNAGSPITLLTTFNNRNAGYTNVTIYGICDNGSNIYINGQKVGSIYGGWWSDGGRGVQIQTTISPGLNLICVEVENWGGPAGLILSIYDSNDSVLTRTSASWKYTSQRATSLISNAQNFSVDSCSDYARSNGFQYFALQSGSAGSSQCYVSNNLDTAKKYDSADSTTIGNDNRTYGIGSINAVYKIKDMGNISNLGKLGYVDGAGLLTEYPKSMISMVNGVPTIVASDESCPKNIVNVDSTVWAAQKKSTSMMDTSTKCGLSSAIQADQSSVDELAEQLQDMSARIIMLIQYLEGLDSTIILQMGINKNNLDNMLSQYEIYNSKFSQYNTTDHNKYDNILSDSDIVSSQQNYNYILWTGIALIVMILTIQVIRKSST